jgi:hypothetical protein
MGWDYTSVSPLGIYRNPKGRLYLYLYDSKVLDLKNQKYFQKLEKGKSLFVPVLGFVRADCERNSDVRERL